MPVPVDPSGMRGPTRGSAQRGRWRRTGSNQYVPADVERTVEQRIVEEWARVPGARVTGWAACRLWGAAFFDGLGPDGMTELPVPLVIDPQRSARGAGVRIVRQPAVPEHEVTRYRIPTLVPGRAALEAARLADDDREAVVALDMAYAAGMVLPEWVEAVLPLAPPRGLGRVRTAMALASERSRSPNETRLRLVWTEDLGWERPLLNREVYREGRLLGIADLIDPVRQLVGEYDGSAHRTRGRHLRDTERAAQLRQAGLEVVTVVGGRLHTPEGRRRAAKSLREAAALPRRAPTYTLRHPRGARIWLPPTDELRVGLVNGGDDRYA